MMAGEVRLASIEAAVLQLGQVMQIQLPNPPFREDLELSMRKATIAGPPRRIFLRLPARKEAGASQVIPHAITQVIGGHVRVIANKGKFNASVVVISR